LDFDRVIPGHGPVTDRAGVKQFQRFMVQLVEIGQNPVDNKLGLKQTLESAALTEDATYDEIKMIMPVGLDRPFVITRAWEDANGKITPRP